MGGRMGGHQTSIVIVLAYDGSIENTTGSSSGNVSTTLSAKRHVT
jgi:hypothetical protein